MNELSPQTEANDMKPALTRDRQQGKDRRHAKELIVIVLVHVFPLPSDKYFYFPSFPVRRSPPLVTELLPFLPPLE